MRAAQYVRMSTEGQQYSTENQMAAIQEYAHKNSFEIVRTYGDEARSGLDLKHRPGLSKLLDDVWNEQADYSVVLVYDVSRWGRFQDVDESAHYEFLCKSRGIRIHYCAELFPNDDSQSSVILKTLRRTMAAEYSRDLSEKVFAGMCRLARKGFKLGGAAGYGLRRLLVDEAGSSKVILEAGQRKFLTTQHVKLILGPEEEVRVVRQIYSMYLNENMTVSDITRFLNRKQIPREVPRPWNDIAVHRILSHPKYAGCAVFGRFSTKMRSDKRLLPRDEWIVQSNSFEPIISPEVFEEVQKKRRNAVWLLTNEEVLERVRAFAEANGAVCHDTLTRGKGVPCYDTLIRRFGNMRQVYDLIGMQFTRVFHLRGGQQKSRIWRMKAGMEFEDSLRAAEIPFRREKFIFTLNACHPLHLQLAWCIGRTHRGDLRWKIHWSRNAHNQPCLAARLTFDNAKILDWFLLMNAPHSQTNFRLSEQAIRGTQSARPSITALLPIIQQRCAIRQDAR